MPIAASRLRQEVDMAGTSITFFSPRRIIEPLPNCFSILAIAISMARLRSVRSSAIFWCPFLSEVPQVSSLYHIQKPTSQIKLSATDDRRPKTGTEATDDRRPSTDDRSERRSTVSRPPSPRIRGSRQPIGTKVAQTLRGRRWEAGLAELLSSVRGAIRKFLKQRNPSRVRALDVVP